MTSITLPAEVDRRAVLVAVAAFTANLPAAVEIATRRAGKDGFDLTPKQIREAILALRAWAGREFEAVTAADERIYSLVMQDMAASGLDPVKQSAQYWAAAADRFDQHGDPAAAERARAVATGRFTPEQAARLLKVLLGEETPS